MTLTFQNESNKIVKDGEQASQATGEALAGAMSGLQSAGQEDIENATVDGRTEKSAVGYLVPILWYFFLLSAENRIPYVYIPLGIFILIQSLRIKSYLICMGNALVFGIYIARVIYLAKFPILAWIISMFVAIIVSYFFLATMTQKIKNRKVAQFILFVVQIFMMFSVATGFTREVAYSVRRIVLAPRDMYNRYEKEQLKKALTQSAQERLKPVFDKSSKIIDANFNHNEFKAAVEKEKKAANNLR